MFLFFVFIYLFLDIIEFKSYCGAKGSGNSGPFDIKPKAHAEKEKCLRTNDHQIVLLRTTLSLAGQNHGRETCHIAQGNPLEDCKRDSKAYELAIGGSQFEGLLKALTVKHQRIEKKKNSSSDATRG